MEDYQETMRHSKIAWEKWAEVLTYFTPVTVVKATILRYLLLDEVKLSVRSLLLLETRFNLLVNW